MARQTIRKSPVTASAMPKVGSTPRSISKTRCAAMPSEQQIRERAYEIFLRRNGGPGDAHSDWAQAERELKEELSR
jgi:hypothetical protein